MKKKIVCLVMVVVLILICCVGCSESFNRTVKSYNSEYGGGLNRTITVYDQNGQVIKQYKGKVDIQDTEYGNKVLFDIDDKRVVIYNGVVIAEEN